MKRLENVSRVRVRFSEIDSMRCAWHGSYVSYFEDGREAFGLQFPGIGYADMQQAGIYAPVYDLHLRFLAPLQLNDIAEIHTLYIHKPGARLDFEYHVYRDNGSQLCAEGSTTQLFIDPKGQLMTDKPDYFQAWQDKFLR